MMAWGLTVMVVAVLIVQTSAGKYQVTEVVHPGCNTLLRLDPNRPLQVTRGVLGAPCVGYVQYDVGAYHRMCSTGDTLFTQANAQRVCFTLGLNTWRETNFNEQIMLYDCDVYTEENVDYPDGAGAEAVAGVGGTGYNQISGKRCLPAIPTPISSCYDQCHIGTGQAVTSAIETACTSDGEPFYAITCSDKDECNNGVLYECSGPFNENCKRRDACGPYTKCQNQIGSWTCECKDGYEPAQGDPDDPYDVSVGCKDENECSTPDKCGYDARCQNTRGSYICTCLYPELWDDPNKKCKEITCGPIPTIPYAVATGYVHTSPVYKDKVTYTCSSGYKVVHQMIPTYGPTSPYVHTPTYYDPYYWYYNSGHHTDTTFELYCTASGYWGPHPSCVRPHCKDPGSIANADRTGDDFDWEEEVTYTCKKGYKPYGAEHNDKQHFVRKCQDDGTWSKGTHCEDIDECSHTDYYTCGPKAKYCHNTVGSYRCSCVQYSEGHDTYDCPDTQYPDACDELERLGLCKNGKCEEIEGKAYCSCKDGYHGSTCEMPWGNTALTIAIVALVLVFIVLIILIMFCCCYNKMDGNYGPHVAPQFDRPIAPIYQVGKPMFHRNFGLHRI